MKQVVILFDELGTMAEPEVVLYDEIHDPIPYIKSRLKNWNIYDEKYQTDLEDCKTVGDAQLLIDEYAIYIMQIHIIEKINPEV